jgi:phytoene synthase
MARKAHAMQRWTQAASYAYCERLARRAAGNFYHAFRILPAGQRRSMCALYAFLRIADDLSDDGGDSDTRRAALDDWRDALHAALQGNYRHPIYPALHHVIERHGIPSRYLEDVLDGVCMDLDVASYDTFNDLYGYCYRVASAVGLACIHVWGFHREDALPAAESAGIALQLTNILRDVAEDADRGRVYLPQEDLRAFGVLSDDLHRGVCNDRFRALMRFQAERARGYYEAALPLTAALAPPGRAVFLVILRTYRALLDAIVDRDFDVFTTRVRLPRWRKLWLAARALPVRWGLLPA